MLNKNSANSRKPAWWLAVWLKFDVVSMELSGSTLQLRYRLIWDAS